MKTKSLEFLKIGLMAFVLMLSACDKKENTLISDNTNTNEPEKMESNITIADYANDQNIDKDVRAFLKLLNNGGPAVESLSPAEAKKVLQNAQASVKVDVSGIDVTEKKITSEGLAIKINIVRPKGVKEKLPVFIFIHGGGWILGDYPTHERLIRDIVVRSGFAAVYVDYSRTPEAQYPVAINEIYAATKWVSEHGDEINVDGKNLAVVGNSVGGNMSAVTALKAKENKGPKIKGMVLMWPIVDSNFETETYKRYGKDRFLTTTLMKWMYDFYIPNPEDRNVIYASPLQASPSQLEGLPPALIIVAENDVLRAEGEAFGRKLNEAGVKVTTTNYLGMIHDFGLLNGLAELPAVDALTAQISGQLKEYLKK